MLTAAQEPSFLATRRGKLTLALLCGIAFLDFVDGSITNVALPTIRRSLGFSVDGLTWIPSGYLLTYGGFMLLGGRLADLLGRRRVLVTGIVIIAISSLAGGFAQSAAQQHYLRYQASYNQTEYNQILNKAVKGGRQPVKDVEARTVPKQHRLKGTKTR